MKKSVCIVLFLIFFCLCLTGCIPGDGANLPSDPAGFFTGVWHGWIAPFSLIYSLFNKGTGIYEIHNNGFAYNLGYYAAIISGFGGLALSRRKGRGKSDE